LVWHQASLANNQENKSYRILFAITFIFLVICKVGVMPNQKKRKP
jgi:hypothetical protein